MSPAVKPLEDLLEKEWAAMLFSRSRGLAGSLGWALTYHVRYTQGSPAGFPDQVLIRDRIIFAELKREKGRPTAHQIEYLDGLAKAGGEVYVWRPSDLDEAARVLSKRWRFLPFGDRTQPVASVTEPPLLVLANGGSAESWTPGSIWVAGVGRYDSMVTESVAEIPGQTTIHDFVS